MSKKRKGWQRLGSLLPRIVRRSRVKSIAALKARAVDELQSPDDLRRAYMNGAIDRKAYMAGVVEYGRAEARVIEELMAAQRHG